MFKVEYITDTGTPSDNEVVGIYSDIELANDAKIKYIDFSIGPKPTKEQFPNQSEFDEFLEDWEYSYERLNQCVAIDPCVNLF